MDVSNSICGYPLVYLLMEIQASSPLVVVFGVKLMDRFVISIGGSLKVVHRRKLRVSPAKNVHSVQRIPMLVVVCISLSPSLNPVIIQ